MRPRWRAGLLAAAGGAVLLAGCGIRVAENPSPSAEPAITAAAPASPAPPSPAPWASPTTPPAVTPSPAPAAGRQTAAAGAAAVAAAERRVEAAAAVKNAMPAFAELAESMVARSGVPGAAVAVVAGDTAAYLRCFGLREMGRPDPVDDDTLFQLGPVSRSYTATMLAALAGEGELSWDQPVRRAWPGFRLHDRWATREATYRDLTAQRSGLPTYAGSELVQFDYGRDEILRRLRYLRPAAGFRAEYAPQDAVFAAAATAAQRATGASWAGLVRTRVLEPIGDTETILGYRGFVTAIDRAAPHRFVGGSMVPQDPSNETVFAPSLGVSSSVTELVSFARLQLNGGALGGVRVAPAGLLAQTVRPTTAAAGSTGPKAAGLGWMLWSFDDRLVASADGGLASGTSAAISLVPDDGLAVIVLANAYPEGVALGRALTKTLIDLAVRGAAQDDWLAREQASVAGDEMLARPKDDVRGLYLPPEAPAGAAAPRQRSAYTGGYENRYYGRVTVSPGLGDGLGVRLGHGATLRYVPWAGDIWRDTASGTAAVFDVRGDRARKVRITLLGFDGRDGTFSRAD